MLALSASMADRLIEAIWDTVDYRGTVLVNLLLGTLQSIWTEDNQIRR